MLSLWLSAISRWVPNGAVEIPDLGCGTGRYSAARADLFNARVIVRRLVYQALADSLGRLIREEAAGLRTYVVLDCCFAASVMKVFMGAGHAGSGSLAGRVDAGHSGRRPSAEPPRCCGPPRRNPYMQLRRICQGKIKNNTRNELFEKASAAFHAAVPISDYSLRRRGLGSS